jgi:hypothetical protein
LTGALPPFWRLKDFGERLERTVQCDNFATLSLPI